MFNSAPHNQVEYTLNSRLGLKTITEPIGWNNDLMEFNRSKNNAGLINKITTNLEFVKDGADYLTELIEKYGTEEECILEKSTKHPTEMKMVKSYRAYIDLNEYKLKEDRVAVTAQESNLLSLINTYKSEKVELEILESFNGNTLEPLNTTEVNIEGKKLLKVSQFDLEEDLRLINLNLSPGNSYEARAVPMNSVSISDPNVGVINDLFVTQIADSYGAGNAYSMFYNDNQSLKTLELDIDISFNVQQYGNIDNIRLDLVTYSDGANFNFVSYETLVSTTLEYVTVSYTDKIILADIPEGYSYALVAHVHSDDFVSLYYTKADLTITENSIYEPTISKTLLPYERFERLLQIITGRTDKDLFYSECLGRTDLGYEQDGEYAYLATTSGFWVRGFTHEVDDVDKKMITSWNDTVDTFFAIKNLAYSLVKNGDLETIVVEPLKEFYQTGIIFDFPLQPNKIERSIATDFQYSSIDIGYTKGGGDYEEVMGLDEPNAKQNLTTPFKRMEKKYSALAKDRGDMTGFEFARRKPKSKFPTEDTPYDKDNFILDCKLDRTNIVFKKWDDYYDIVPDNIYSPETATNLGITPKRNLINHGWWINSGLFRYPDNIKFASSEGNSSLKTKVAGESEIQENADLPISFLDSPKFVTRWVEFEHYVDYDLAEKLQGYTIVNGKRIPNTSFEWRFINENGVYEKCRIWDVKPDKEGKFKVIKVR